MWHVTLKATGCEKILSKMVSTCGAIVNGTTISMYTPQNAEGMKLVSA